MQLNPFRRAQFGHASIPVFSSASVDICGSPKATKDVSYLRRYCSIMGAISYHHLRTLLISKRYVSNISTVMQLEFDTYSTGIYFTSCIFKYLLTLCTEKVVRNYKDNQVSWKKLLWKHKVFKIKVFDKY